MWRFWKKKSNLVRIVLKCIPSLFVSTKSKYMTNWTHSTHSILFLFLSLLNNLLFSKKKNKITDLRIFLFTGNFHEIKTKFFNHKYLMLSKTKKNFLKTFSFWYFAPKWGLYYLDNWKLITFDQYNLWLCLFYVLSAVFRSKFLICSAFFYSSCQIFSSYIAIVVWIYKP